MMAPAALLLQPPSPDEPRGHISSEVDVAADDLVTDVAPLLLGPVDLGDEEAPAVVLEDVDKVVRAVDALHAAPARVHELLGALEGVGAQRERKGLGLEDAAAEAHDREDVEELGLQT